MTITIALAFERFTHFLITGKRYVGPNEEHRRAPILMLDDVRFVVCRHVDFRREVVNPTARGNFRLSLLKAAISKRTILRNNCAGGWDVYALTGSVYHPKGMLERG
jgi:hypothetical protein